MLWTAPASAHDTLLAASPEADEVLDHSPEAITLEFSGDGLTTGETITNTILLRDANGENWEGETEVEGSAMSTELPEPLPNGEFDVVYRVVYSDGHSEEHSYSFEVADPDAEDEIVLETTEPWEGEPSDNAADASGSVPSWVLGLGAGAAAVVVVIVLVMRRPGTAGD
ncbi:MULTISPECIES: copper resistance CopC family protein [Actinomycetes]|uniref:copper resistance CopC family protein n=1 Tax=Actinomycetes TaxID=1760 RepID=UPI0031D96D97